MHFIHTVQCDVELGTRGGPIQRIYSDVSVPPDALCYLHLCCIFGGLCRYRVCSIDLRLMKENNCI